jgi:hypothetical protein
MQLAKSVGRRSGDPRRLAAPAADQARIADAGVHHAKGQVDPRPEISVIRHGSRPNSISMF